MKVIGKLMLIQKDIPVKNDKEINGLLSGKIVTVYRAENDFSIKDVYGNIQIIDNGTQLRVHILVNSDSKHLIYVDKKNNRYFPSDYRGEDQIETIENNITNVG